MIIIPKGTPGLNIVRNVYNMHHPYPGHFRSGGHAEILLEDCRVPVANRIGDEGDGFVLAQKRLPAGASTTRCAGSASATGRST